MTKRLQVLFNEDEYQEIQGVARRPGMTMAGWVRQALRKARTDDTETVDGKLGVITDASSHQFPTADIDVMLQEIESGRRIT